MNLTLVIMAAGMGSRYGGLKQLEPVGPSGEIIMEYSIYDAVEAGFDKVVFIIKKDFERTFKDEIGKKVESKIQTEYVAQDVNQLPGGFGAPAGRTKPWGTAHAVLSCKEAVDTPFAVINADDFYGKSSFRALADFLSRETGEFCMVGFELAKTLTENGHVARGICTVDENDYLLNVVERTKIEKFENSAKYTLDDKTWILLPEKTIVSMNTWGFTPKIFPEIESRFSGFLRDNEQNIEKAEFYLPAVVGELIAENKAAVKALHTNEKWYGVTYKEDLPTVSRAIREFSKNGLYPNNLWE